jgi:hypothetical protein
VESVAVAAARKLPEGGREMSIKALLMRSALAGREAWTREAWTREPWTVERALHLGLAAIVVIGWTLAYAALMRGVDGPQDIARSDRTRTAISVNLVPQ